MAESKIWTVHEFFGCKKDTLRKGVWSKDEDEELSWGKSFLQHYTGQVAKEMTNECDVERILKKNRKRSIPKSIHFIWLGDSPLPLPCDISSTQSDDSCMLTKPIQSWKEYHPEWKIHIWRDNVVRNNEHVWYNQDVLDFAMRQGNYGLASDVLRLELLYKYGGMYADIDYICLGSIDNFHLEYDFYAGASNTGCIEVNNGILASKPNHPLVRKMMESIRCWFSNRSTNFSTESLFHHHALSPFLDEATANSLHQASMVTTPSEVIAHTGPGLVTRTLGKLLSQHHYESGTNEKDQKGTEEQICLSRVAVLPYSVFHPLANTNRHSFRWDHVDRYAVPDETKAIHLFLCSWQIKK